MSRIPVIDHVEPSCDVSIVIPLRNERDYIDACLDSVLDQDLDGLKLEVLLVDGMSTDGTREMIARRSADDARVKLLDNPAGLVSPALNIGIRASRGRVLVRMDAHSEYARDYVKAALEVLSEQRADAVGGVQVPIPGAPTPIARAIAAAQMTRLGTGGGHHRRADYDGPAETLWLGVFGREVVERIGGFDEVLFRSEDNDFFERIRAGGGRLWVSARISARYRCRPTLRDYAKQCWTTGTQLVPTWRRNPRALALRHLAPAALLTTLIGLALASVFWSQAGIGLVVALLTYVAAIVGTSLLMSARLGVELFLPLLVVFPSAHFAYAAGTLLGLFSLARDGTGTDRRYISPR
jgi:succinoglycan biosynthesis protein ExoA